MQMLLQNYWKKLIPVILYSTTHTVLTIFWQCLGWKNRTKHLIFQMNLNVNAHVAICVLIMFYNYFHWNCGKIETDENILDCNNNTNFIKTNSQN